MMRTGRTWYAGERFEYSGDKYLVKSVDTDGAVYAKKLDTGTMALIPKIEMVNAVKI